MLHVGIALLQAALRGQMQPRELRAFVALAAVGVFGGGYAIRASRRGVWGAAKALLLLAVAHSSRGLIISTLHDVAPTLLQRLRQLQASQPGVSDAFNALTEEGPSRHEHARHQLSA